MRKPKTLIISVTHGDEEFSIPVVKSLKKRFMFDWIIANKKAFKMGKRFYEKDLNRSGPGNVKSKIYEERRAKEVIQVAKKYDNTIDLHGTVSSTGCFIILSDPNWQNIELAKKLDVKNVVLWPSLEPTGPMSQFIPNSLEIECGPKNSKKTAQRLKNILVKYFEGKESKIQKNFYVVNGKFIKNTRRPMKEFKKFFYKGESFYPLMIGQYPGIKCYMMQRLSDTL